MVAGGWCVAVLGTQLGPCVRDCCCFLVCFVVWLVTETSKPASGAASFMRVQSGRWPVHLRSAGNLVSLGYSLHVDLSQWYLAAW